MTDIDLHSELQSLRKEMREELAALRGDMQPIVDAYKAGSITFAAIKGIAQFLIVTAGGTAIIIAVWQWLKTH